MKIAILVVILITLLAMPAFAGTPVYTDDFEGNSYIREGVGVGIGGAYLWPEGGANRVSVTSTGRHFLGGYTASSEMWLDLSGLPQHTNVSYSFDLYVIGPWAGNGPPDTDFWGITADGRLGWGGTFSNMASLQTYPVMQGSSGYQAHTGATEVNTLGYSADSVYHISGDVSHTSGDLRLHYFTCLHYFGDKSWGIDNVRIETSPSVPEPSSLLAIGTGVVTLTTLKRRRRS